MDQNNKKIYIGWIIHPIRDDTMDISDLMKMDKDEMMRIYFSLPEDERMKIDKQAIELMAPLFMFCNEDCNDEEKISKLCGYSNVWKNVIKKYHDDN